MITVLIADDHALVRRGLRQLLEEENDICIAADVESGAEALSILKKTHCDVILVDMTMPQKHGLELIDDLQREFPAVRILVLSMHSERQLGIRAFKAGASGYLTKNSDPGEIVKAIRRIAEGGKYITPKLAELLELQLHSENVRASHEDLSSREFAVFLKIAEGKSVGEIAAEIFLSVKTISTYRTRALEKMKMKTNADIIHYAHRTGLVQ